MGKKQTQKYIQVFLRQLGRLTFVDPFDCIYNFQILAIVTLISHYSHSIHIIVKVCAIESVYIICFRVQVWPRYDI